MSYSYQNLTNDIQRFRMLYPFIEIGSVGKSVLGNDLIYLKIGCGAKQVFYNASFHANEWITTPLVMKFIEDYAQTYLNNGKLLDYSAQEIYEKVTLYVIPMVNPDGVNLVNGAELSTENEQIVENYVEKVRNIANDFPAIPFPSRLEGKYKWG